jgi:DNA ligase-1
MEAFAALVLKLGQSARISDKQKALVSYIESASPSDKLWAVALLTGKRAKRVVSTVLLKQWTCELAEMPLWLFEETYQHVGDLGETIALLLPRTFGRAEGNLDVWMRRMLEIKDMDGDAKRRFVESSWSLLSPQACFVFNKLMGGHFRIGVGEGVVAQALAVLLGVSREEVLHRLSGQWSPLTDTFDELMTGAHIQQDTSRPYPFFLAHALSDDLGTMGEPEDWLVEWKWDGIRGQLIKRQHTPFLWSRGGELLTERFPDLSDVYAAVPDGTVLDGEILAWKQGAPLPFNSLQTRIGRNRVSKKQLEEAPVRFMAYDVLEWGYEDQRQKSLLERRRLLDAFVSKVDNGELMASPLVDFTDWHQLASVRDGARSNGSEGLMIKRLSSAYQSGRKRGDWWKWKLDPMSVDCVLVAAQKGHGRRANLYTDYTFAIRDEGSGALVTLTKAYSGLTDAEIREVDQWINRHVLERFGPVRTVPPRLVFEIGFEGISASKRHKSGLALRFPRILRRRNDKPVEEIGTLAELKALLH